MPAARPPRRRAGQAAAPQALTGIRIVSLAQHLPGPLALARLIEAGATALKIEPPAGDPMAGWSRVWYRQMHRGVTVERVDLKTAAGRARLSRALVGADLLLTSHRPAALARLGLDPDRLAATYRRLRGVNIVGDTTAPDQPGHDLTYQARAGLVGSTMPVTLLADLFGAERAVSACLLLLRQPAPAHIQVGLRDALAAASLPLTLGLTDAGARFGGGLPTYRLYEARRGVVAVAALEPHFRARLYEALALPDGHDLSDVMRMRTARAWARWAEARDIPLAVVEPPRRPNAGRRARRSSRA